MKTQAQFKAAHANCPSCNSVDTNIFFTEPTPTGYYSEIDCESCSTTYRVHYAVVSYAHLPLGSDEWVTPS